MCVSECLSDFFCSTCQMGLTQLRTHICVLPLHTSYLALKPRMTQPQPLTYIVSNCAVAVVGLTHNWKTHKPMSIFYDLNVCHDTL